MTNPDHEKDRYEHDEDTVAYRKADNMAPYNPKLQTNAYFYLAISGHIESGEFRDLDGVSIKFDFVAGKHWKLAKGIDTGIS